MSKVALQQIQRERDLRAKGEKPWTQVHDLSLLSPPAPLRAPRPRRLPGECGTSIKFPKE